MKREIRKYLSKIGSKGGTMRAARYDKAALSKWAKLGGRPKRNTAPNAIPMNKSKSDAR